MRLLRVTDLAFQEVPSHEPFPKYAILSHTWMTPNSQEVTFQNLERRDTSGYEGKPGWRKIKGLIERARKDNQISRRHRL